MKKLVTILLAACMAAFCGAALVGCGDDSGLGDDYTLTVGFDSGYPPYGYIADDGSYTGFDLDLAQEVCERNGWNFKAEPIDWDAKDQLLNAGTITCIWNGFTYEGREDAYVWSDLYMMNGQVVCVKADSDIASLDDLKGKIVMTQVQSAAWDLLQGDQKALADTFKELQTIDTYTNAFMQLESGAVDAVVCDLSIAGFNMSAKPDVFKQVGDPLNGEHYAVGFSKNDENAEAAVETINATLQEMYEDGTIEELVNKYADQGMDMSMWCLGEAQK